MELSNFPFKNPSGGISLKGVAMHGLLMGITKLGMTGWLPRLLHRGF